MMPMAPWLMEGHWDPNDLMNVISKKAICLYESSERGKQLKEIGHLKQFTGHHKRQEYEVGGHRFIIALCTSERPYFGYSFEPDSGKPKELLHLYGAMGMTKQDDEQAVSLARVADYKLASLILSVVKEMFPSSRVSVRCISKHTQDHEKQLQLWADCCSDYGAAQSRLVHLHEDQQWLTQAVEIKYQPEIVTSIFERFWSGEQRLLSLLAPLEAVMLAVNAEEAHAESGAVAPRVSYLHEVFFPPDASG